VRLVPFWQKNSQYTDRKEFFVMKEEFAGQLSRVVWDDTDVQLQTEIRYKPEPRLLVIFVADGTVVSRVEKPWKSSNKAAKEHSRIREFHERLTTAMKRLRDKAYIELDELKKVSVRLVNAAMNAEGPKNRAEDAISLIPGSKWVVIANKESGSFEATAISEKEKLWIAPLRESVKVAAQMAALLDAGGISDSTLKTEDGFIILGDGEEEILITLTAPDKMPVARQMVIRLQKTLLR
jgi:hypothetical protein